ncbi:MAG TPA: metallophosphoesterase [Leptolyngbya sp.]|nr:metallophosphoesterase [Leptolyngbya sp.]
MLAIWSFIEPHTLNTERQTAKIPRLPPAWQGKQVAQLSDFQIGMWAGNSDTVRRSVEQIIAVKPAAVLISGDFIYHAAPNPEPKIKTAVDLVKPLVEAGIPTYAVLGNHDYGMSDKTATPGTDLASSLATALKSAGITVLENQAARMQLTGRNEPLYLVGINSRWANRDDVKDALSNVPNGSPRIAMMHNPDSFEMFPANTAPLAIAGHTHGGQVRVPFSPQWSWLRLTQNDKVHADGWAKGYGKSGNNLYVNVGIGMSIAPIRLFCPPELTFFTLETS